MPRGDRTQPLQPRVDRPNIGYDRAGPTQIERILQDNTMRPSSGGMDLDLLRNLQQGPGVIDRTIQDHTPPGGGVIKPQNPGIPPWYNDIGEGSFWNVQAPQQSGNNSGVMAAMAGNPMVQQAKGFYEQIDPWIPSMDFGERKLGFDFERPILGGTLGYGMDYDWDDENIGAYAKYVIGLGG